MKGASRKSAKAAQYITRCCVCFSFILMQALFNTADAQEVPATTPVIVEQQIENLTENGDDVETEDDAYLQQMEHFLKDPVNLNTATESDLKELPVFTPLQIENLISYRNLFGNFINIYELQAIPSWNISLIRKVKPYVTVTTNLSAFISIGSRLRNGEKSVLVRVTQ